MTNWRENIYVRMYVCVCIHTHTHTFKGMSPGKVYFTSSDFGHLKT